MILLGPEGDERTPPQRRLDAVDEPWAGLVSSYTFLGLRSAPSVEHVRAVLRDATTAGSPFARLVDPVTARWEPVAAAELESWVESMIRTAPPLDGDAQAAERLLAEPLGVRPVYVVVCPDALLLRVNHVVGDGVANHALVRRLLGSGEGPMPLAEPSSRLQRRVLGTLASHPVRTAKAVAALRRPTTERYVPAREVAVDQPVLVSARTDAGFGRRLLAVRDAYWPGASFSAMLLVGVRRALAEHVATPRPGAELLVDVRRWLGDDAPELGNLARGVYVTAADDDDPRSVSEAIARQLDRAVPLASLGASLVLRHARRVLHPRRPEVGEPLVAAPGGGPRIALTYLRGLGGPVPDPFRPGGGLWTATAPNGPEGVTVLVRELGDTFALDATCHPDVLEVTAVKSALEHLLTDPEGLLAGAAA